MVTDKRIEKRKFSEWVVRQALYWMTPVSRWTLDETESEWIIALEDESFAVRSELDRLLNDYLLREKLMSKTHATREAISQAVLEGINKKVTA